MLFGYKMNLKISNFHHLKKMIKLGGFVE